MLMNGAHIKNQKKRIDAVHIKIERRFMTRAKTVAVLKPAFAVGSHPARQHAIRPATAEIGIERESMGQTRNPSGPPTP